jgi:hypothetical protein
MADAPEGFRCFRHYFDHPLGPSLQVVEFSGLHSALAECIKSRVFWYCPNIESEWFVNGFLPTYCKLECLLFVGMQHFFVVLKIPVNFALLIRHFWGRGRRSCSSDKCFGWVGPLCSHSLFSWMMLNAPEACKFIPRCLSYYIILPLLPYEFLNCSSCKYLDLEIITGTYWNHLYRHWNTKDPSPEGSPEVPPGRQSSVTCWERFATKIGNICYKSQWTYQIWML